MENGYERDPYIWDTIISLNERIQKGERLCQETNEQKKGLRTRYQNVLIAMKRRRKFVNQAFRVQCALPRLLHEPENVFRAIYLLRKEYFIINDGVDSEEKQFHDFEKELLEEPEGKQLLERIEFFNLSYDYDNWALFYVDAQKLLNDMVIYVLTGLNKIKKISDLPLKN